jgi:hypothetical protein
MPVKYAGHESFACSYAWLPKSLQAIHTDPRAFADEDQAMVELGLGKNMVRSAKFWVEASGMARSTAKGLEPTALGKLIFGGNGRDRFMEDIQTLWLIHWNLSAHVEDRLFGWDFLISRWHEPEFTESSVLRAFEKEVDGRSKRLSSVTLQQHLQVFLHTYVPTRGRKGDIAEDKLDCPLTELEMLIKTGERAAEGQTRREPVYAFRREEKPNISRELFAYCVDDFWTRMYPNEQTLSVRTDRERCGKSRPDIQDSRTRHLLPTTRTAGRHASVAEEVNNTFDGEEPTNCATWSLAASMADRASAPGVCTLFGLPGASRKNGSMAARTGGSTGVVAL